MLSPVTCLPMPELIFLLLLPCKLAFVSQEAGFYAGSHFTLQAVGWDEVEHLS